MNSFLKILMLLVLFASCKVTYHQIYETKSSNTKFLDHSYIFENDSLLIKYSFWAEDGVFAFSIYNKLSKPIYIDWKKSSFIVNSKKFNYWVDSEKTRSLSIYKDYLFLENRLGYDNVLTNLGLSLTNSVKIKNERITFIPPKSYVYRSKFKITNKLIYELNTNVDEYDNLNSSENRKMYMKEFQKENSLFSFRNFMTISDQENFKTEFYVDNDFYISKITEIDTRDFKLIKKDENGKDEFDENGRYIYHQPYKRSDSFYKILYKGNSVFYRKKWSQ